MRERLALAQTRDRCPCPFHCEFPFCRTGPPENLPKRDRSEVSLKTAVCRSNEAVGTALPATMRATRLPPASLRGVSARLFSQSSAKSGAAAATTTKTKAEPAAAAPASAAPVPPPVAPKGAVGGGSLLGKVTPPPMTPPPNLGHIHEFKPTLTVIGVGGAGGNAVNNMIQRGLKGRWVGGGVGWWWWWWEGETVAATFILDSPCLTTPASSSPSTSTTFYIQPVNAGVDFVVANTDAQHLATCLTDNRIQMGKATTQGLGCGANPDAGKEAALESLPEIMAALDGSHMVFITAGMGGGTGE